MNTIIEQIKEAVAEALTGLPDDERINVNIFILPESDLSRFKPMQVKEAAKAIGVSGTKFNDMVRHRIIPILPKNPKDLSSGRSYTMDGIIRGLRKNLVTIDGKKFDG